MLNKEKILFSLKDNQELREEVLYFAKKLTGQPIELLDVALTDYLDQERNDYIRKYDGIRNMSGLKYLWDAKSSSKNNLLVENEAPSPEEERMAKEREKILKKKTLLVKNFRSCPECESDDTYLHERREHSENEVPDFSKEPVEKYWVCNDCGKKF